MRLAIHVLLGVSVATTAHAEVLAIGPSGFEIRNEAVVNAPSSRVYAALAQRVGHWWDPAHTYSGDARNMSIEARPGGCFCEEVPGKGAIEHMRVLYVSTDEVFRLSGGLGPLQESGLAGTLTWTLKAEEDGTRVTQDYRVGGFRVGGFEELAPIVGQVLEIQLQRLKRLVETGDPADK